MTELGPILERLGLDQYLEALLAEGFDTWETVLDIQEGDLDALNVKLGHRRKLQREIANYRGIPWERAVSSPVHENSIETGKIGESSRAFSQSEEKGSTPTGEAKRKYRRHPKPDINAPEKPPSAYVLFSNNVREEIKGDKLNFTQIAKLVGDRWQRLDPSEKEPYETLAAAAKERYHIQLSAYKKTDTYKEYAEYLADFKLKHPGTTEGKRPRLDKDESSATSMSAKSADFPDTNLGHERVGSVGSTSTASNTIPSPSGHQLSFSPSGGQIIGSRPSAGASLHLESLATQASGVPRLRSTFSAHSSTSDESWVSRNDQAEAVQRTAQLSLGSAPPIYPALASFSPGDPSLVDPSGRRPIRHQYIPNQREILSPINSELPNFHRSRTPPVGVSPMTSPEERWRTVLPDPPSRQVSDSSRPFLPPLHISQIGSAGGGQLLRAIIPERGSELPQEQLQRTLPPLREQGRVLPSPIRGLVRPGQSGTGTEAGGVGRGGSAAPLQRSESEAVDALAGLAAIGTPREDLEEHRTHETKRR